MPLFSQIEEEEVERGRDHQLFDESHSVRWLGLLHHGPSRCSAGARHEQHPAVPHIDCDPPSNVGASKKEASPRRKVEDHEVKDPATSDQGGCSRTMRSQSDQRDEHSCYVQREYSLQTHSKGHKLPKDPNHGGFAAEDRFQIKSRSQAPRWEADRAESTGEDVVTEAEEIETAAGALQHDAGTDQGQEQQTESAEAAH